MTKHPHNCSCCSHQVSRRAVLKAAGASTFALQVGVFDFASKLMADESKATQKPVVRVVFIRPKDQAKYWMSWPGNDYQADEQQARFTEQLSKIADEIGVELQVDAAALENEATVDAALGRVKQSPPHGIIVIQMHLSYWAATNRFLSNRGDIPTIVFSRMGTSFTGHLQAARAMPKTYVATTLGRDWLQTGMRMLKTIDGMKKSRLCIITGDKTYDRKLDPLGTTLHYIPLQSWLEALKSVQTSDEIRAIADFYTKKAKKIIEPGSADILNAAKNYIVAKKIMAAENCDGISLNCLDLVRHRKIACPPCIAWMRLNDEGSVGACEADWNAAISLRLSSLLLGRPGFMQDPAPNTVNNTLMGAHCSCPSKLNGFDKPAEPFILRDHHESETGVAPQVLWRIGQEVTVMEFDGPAKIIVGTGRVVSNIDTPPEGGCRTSVELAMDTNDCLDTRGFHQLFIYGKHDRQIKAYGQLAGIKVEPID